MISQKAMSSAHLASQYPDRRKLADEMGSEVVSRSSLDKSDSLSSIPSIDADQSQSEAAKLRVKKVSKTKPARKTLLAKGKNGLADENPRNVDGAARAKIKSKVAAKSDSCPDVEEDVCSVVCRPCGSPCSSCSLTNICPFTWYCHSSLCLSIARSSLQDPLGRHADHHLFVAPSPGFMARA